MKSLPTKSSPDTHFVHTPDGAFPEPGREPFSPTPEELEAHIPEAVSTDGFQNGTRSLAISQQTVEYKNVEGTLKPTNEQQSEALVGEKEAARILGVPVSNLRYRRWQGQPPEWVQIGARVRYRPSTLAAFIERNTVKLQASEPPGGAR
jgi:hypothetical protein